MSKKTELIIDSIDQSDLNELFSVLCEEAFNMSVTEAKDYLEINNNSRPSVDQILKLCVDKGVSFNINFSYTKDSGKVLNKSSARHVPNFNQGMNLCDTVSKMEQQKVDITNPDLVDLAKNHVPMKIEEPVKEEIKKFDFGKIPPFKV